MTQKRLRFEITERQITQIGSLGFMSPDDVISAHLLFDLATRVLDGPSAHRTALRQTVVAGFQLFGLNAPGVVRSWPPLEAESPAGDRSQRRYEADELVEALAEVPDQEDSRTLSRLWRLRSRLALLPLSWDFVIEGHPVLCGLEAREDRREIAGIADDVLRAARENVGVMHRIDRTLLRLYRAPTPLPQVTYRDLAQRCPAAVTFSEFDGPEAFGLREGAT